MHPWVSGVCVHICAHTHIHICLVLLSMHVYTHATKVTKWETQAMSCSGHRNMINAGPTDTFTGHVLLYKHRWVHVTKKPCKSVSLIFRLIVHGGGGQLRGQIETTHSCEQQHRDFKFVLTSNFHDKPNDQFAIFLLVWHSDNTNLT